MNPRTNPQPIESSIRDHLAAGGQEFLSAEESLSRRNGKNAEQSHLSECGGSRWFPIRTEWAARIAQFPRSRILHITRRL